MQVYEYQRNGPGSGLWVEITGHGLRVSPDHKKGRALPFSEITTLRYFTTESPQRTDYGLLIAGQGKTLEINYVRLRAMRDRSRDREFNRTVSAVLAAVAEARPDLEVISGRAPLARWLIFLCFLIPAVLGLTMAAVLFPESDAKGIAIPAFMIGAVSLIAAIGNHPLKRPERIAARDLADLFAAESAAPSSPAAL